MEYEDRYVVVKEEHMPDGRTKLILRDKETNRIVQKVVSAEG